MGIRSTHLRAIWKYSMQTVRLHPLTLHCRMPTSISLSVKCLVCGETTDIWPNKVTNLNKVIKAALFEYSRVLNPGRGSKLDQSAN